MMTEKEQELRRISYATAYRLKYGYQHPGEIGGGRWGTGSETSMKTLVLLDEAGKPTDLGRAKLAEYEDWEADE